MIGERLSAFDERVGNEWAAPTFTPADVIRSAKSFSHDTAGGHDGLHVRQAALVPEQGLRYFAASFSTFAAFGALPSRASDLTNS